MPSGSARSVVYLERYLRHAVCAGSRSGSRQAVDHLGQNGRLEALAVTPHGASGLCEHVKYLVLSLLSHAPPRITSRCSSSRETLVTSRSRPRRSSRQTQPCLLRGLTSAAGCRRATTRRSSNRLPFIRPHTSSAKLICTSFLPLRHVDRKEETLPFEPGANSFELRLCASRCWPSLQPPEVYSLHRVMGVLQPRACRVRPGLISAAQLGRGLPCRRDGRGRMWTTHGSR